MEPQDYKLLLETLEDIKNLSHNEIPFYAYGDNEAACCMSNKLGDINSRTFDLINLLKKNAN